MNTVDYIVWVRIDEAEVWFVPYGIGINYEYFMYHIVQMRVLLRISHVLPTEIRLLPIIIYHTEIFIQTKEATLTVGFRPFQFAPQPTYFHHYRNGAVASRHQRLFPALFL
jgi:hypothetical protein